MINDNDKFDEIIRNAAQDYNRPPSIVPRDDMWAAIEAAQAERARRPLHIVPAAPRTSIRRYAWISAAAAAVLMLGIGIGRVSTGTSPIPSRAVALNPVPSKPVPDSRYPMVGTRGSETTPEETPSPAGGAEIPEAVPESAPNRVASTRGSSGRRAPEIGRRPSGTALQGTARISGNGSAVATYAPSDASLTYQVATVRHLSNAEALLTAFRNDSRDAKMDASLSKWARDLLANTRLLLDSPAADDPQRARLLGDLELVLAEIVQLSPGASANDRSLIEGSIQNGHVLTRLRSAIPAGQRGL